MTQIQKQNPLEKEPFAIPSPGRFRDVSRAFKEGAAREKAERAPAATPEDAGLDECLTATYWG